MKVKVILPALAAALAVAIAVPASAQRGGGQSKGQQGSRMHQPTDRGTSAQDTARARQEMAEQERKRLEAESKAQGEQVREREEKVVRERERLEADGAAQEAKGSGRREQMQQQLHKEQGDGVQGAQPIEVPAAKREALEQRTQERVREENPDE